MKKTMAVLKREYLQAVRKKSFIIMTFLFPVFMAAVMVLPSLLMAKGLSGKRVAVIDGTGALRDTFSKPVELSSSRRRDLPGTIDIEYVASAGRAVEETAKPYLARVPQAKKEGRLDAVMLIPVDALTAESARLKFYTRASTDFITQERLASIANRGLQRIRLQQRGISRDDLETIMRSLGVDGVQISKTGEQKAGGAANFFIGFIFTALLFVPSLIYGLETMRGILQEKTDRVVEVLISSMTPAELLTGKILGIAAVGLTQIAVWIVMLAGAGAFAAATAVMSGVNVAQFLRISTFVWFGVFFVLAYLTYVCVYAIGGAVCNNEKEANQFIMPIIMIMMLPWFILVALITNPDSTMSVALSMAPLFAPITMFVRTLVSEPPLWHIAVAIGVSVLTIAGFFWVTAKIFRVGILSYGKRPTIPELWRWLKMA
ncbi:MAG TPA: ABC transporter permease [Thermoanaerobaculia bacterium]|nr:ABC transporter permease [Thermoanaerobaculia bacterium]